MDDSRISDPYVSVSVMGMEKRTDQQCQSLICTVDQLPLLRNSYGYGMRGGRDSYAGDELESVQCATSK